MEAGCWIRLSTPPRETARAGIRTVFRTFLPASIPPLSSKEINEPGPPIWAAISSAWGWPGSPGKATRSTAGWAASSSATAWALA
jgi:hypothetical protein